MGALTHTYTGFPFRVLEPWVNRRREQSPGEALKILDYARQMVSERAATPPPTFATFAKTNP